MQFEYEPERLIHEVKKRPGIWDFEDINYRAKNYRHKLWSEVVNALMQDDVKISKSEMRELELQLQKKWKSMRDCFQKYITNPNRTKRPYIYTKQLRFLLKDQELPQAPASASESEGENVKEQYTTKVWKPKRKIKVVKETTDDEDNNSDNHGSSYSNDVEISAPMKIPKTNKCIVDEFAFASVDATKSDPDDPDKLFLLSLLPDLKSVPEAYRLNVKMELMQVLQNAACNAGRDHKII